MTSLSGTKAHFFKACASVSAPPFVPTALDQHVEHFALGVDGAPEVDHATFDPEIDFVRMPGRMRLWPSSTQVGRDPRSKK